MLSHFFFVSIATAQTLCKIDHIAGNGAKFEASIDINYQTKTFSVNESKEKIIEVAEVSEIAIAQSIKSYYACQDSAPACIRALVDSVPKGLSDGQKSLYMGLQMVAIQRGAKAPFAEKNYLIDLESVTTGKALITGKTKFGYTGLFEYFNAKGEIISRLLIRVPTILECR